MKKLKAFACIALVLLTVFTTIVPACADNPNKVTQIAIDHALQSSDFAPSKYKFSGPCWKFVNALSKAIYGTGIGSPNGYTLSSNSNWSKVGQLTGKQSDSAIATLLKKAKPGSLLQYKNTFATFQHTVMVYSVNNDSITIYDATTCDSIKKRTYSYGNLASKMGKWSDASHGITVYNCKKSVNYDVKWSEKKIGKNGRITGCDWYGLESGPRQGENKLEWLAKGSSVQVIASYVNEYGNTWLKVKAPSGNIGYVYYSYVAY